VGADEGLIAYIERHRRHLADTFPETATIEEGDFNEVCFRALNIVGQLTTKAQPGTEEGSGQSGEGVGDKAVRL
jgi:hypothetical protein